MGVTLCRSYEFTMNPYDTEIEILVRDCEKVARTYALNLDNVLWSIKTKAMKSDWRQKQQTRIDEYVPKV